MAESNVPKCLSDFSDKVSNGVKTIVAMSEEPIASLDEAREAMKSVRESIEKAFRRNSLTRTIHRKWLQFNKKTREEHLEDIYNKSRSEYTRERINSMAACPRQRVDSCPNRKTYDETMRNRALGRKLSAPITSLKDEIGEWVASKMSSTITKQDDKQHKDESDCSAVSEAQSDDTDIQPTDRRMIGGTKDKRMRERNFSDPGCKPSPEFIRQVRNLSDETNDGQDFEGRKLPHTTASYGTRALQHGPRGDNTGRDGYLGLPMKHGSQRRNSAPSLEAKECMGLPRPLTKAKRSTSPYRSNMSEQPTSPIQIIIEHPEDCESNHEEQKRSQKERCSDNLLSPVSINTQKPVTGLDKGNNVFCFPDTHNNSVFHTSMGKSAVEKCKEDLKVNFQKPEVDTKENSSGQKTVKQKKVDYVNPLHKKVIISGINCSRKGSPHPNKRFQANGNLSVKEQNYLSRKTAANVNDHKKGVKIGSITLSTRLLTVSEQMKFIIHNIEFDDHYESEKEYIYLKPVVRMRDKKLKTFISKRKQICSDTSKIRIMEEYTVRDLNICKFDSITINIRVFAFKRGIKRTHRCIGQSEVVVKDLHSDVTAKLVRC